MLWQGIKWPRISNPVRLLTYLPLQAGSQAVWQRLRRHVATLPLILNLGFSLRNFLPLPTVHSDAEGGLLKLPQSVVIMLAMLNAVILFLQQFTCSHLCPLQHCTSPQFVGLDVRLINTPQASHPLIHVDRKAAQLPFALCVFMPSSLSVPFPFRPLSLDLKFYPHDIS